MRSPSLPRSLRELSPVCIPAALAFSLSCTGDVTLESENPVTQGEALGFDSINYVATVVALPSNIQDVLIIDADGRTTFRSGPTDSPSDSIYPTRFLLDEELLTVRTAFHDSNFFEWTGTTFGDSLNPEKQFIDYQVDGRSAQIGRRGRAEVPRQLLPVFQLLERLVEESRQVGNGAPIEVGNVFEGGTSRIRDREFVVVHSEDELINLLWRIGSIEVSVLPRVDFDREMLVGVFLGARSGLTEQVSVVTPARRNGSDVNVFFRRTDRPAACIEPGLHPFALARLPLTSGVVGFFEIPERMQRQCSDDDR